MKAPKHFVKDCENAVESMEVLLKIITSTML